MADQDRRFIPQAKETMSKYQSWGVWDLVDLGWAIYYKDGSTVGATGLNEVDATIAADRLEDEKDLVGVDAVPVTDNDEDW